MIAGNHDYCLDLDSLLSMHSANSQIYDEAIALVQSSKAKKAGLTYLQDEQLVLSVDGKEWKIYGSPWSAAFCSMAFNVPRGGASEGELAFIRRWGKTTDFDPFRALCEYIQRHRHPYDARPAIRDPRHRPLRPASWVFCPASTHEGSKA